MHFSGYTCPQEILTQPFSPNEGPDNDPLIRYLASTRNSKITLWWSSSNVTKLPVHKKENCEYKNYKKKHVEPCGSSF